VTILSKIAGNFGIDRSTEEFFGGNAFSPGLNAGIVILENGEPMAGSPTIGRLRKSLTPGFSALEITVSCPLMNLNSRTSCINPGGRWQSQPVPLS